MAQSSKQFSLIIPAFNEKERLPQFLFSLSEEIIKSNLIGEVIIVDDGSAEEHQKAYLELVNSIRNIDIKVIRHDKNRGKGAAIQTGFRVAAGDWIGFVDADGSTSSEEIMRLIKIAVSSENLDGVFGSRIRMLGYNIKRKLLRHIFGRIFVTLVHNLLNIPMYDFQCGFKFFRRIKISPFLEICKEQGYLFDLELVSIGYLNNLNFLEVPISWSDVPGSKIHLIRDGFRMFFGIFCIRGRLAKIGLQGR